MGIDKETISSAIRISWGADSDLEAIKENVGQLIVVAKSLSF